MGSPIIFNGTRAKLLTSNGLLTTAGRTIDFDGGINYIANSGLEINSTGWATYANAAGVSPVNGTGGAPSITFVRSTTTPLFQTASGLITYPASNNQGNGISFDFSVDSGLYTTPCTIGMTYKVASGTYDSSLITWIYDVTNSVLLPCTAATVLNAVGAYTLNASFQPNYNSTSYRLIFHCSTTTAVAWTMQIDNISVRPNTYNPGAVTTYPTAYTPTFSAGFGTATSINVTWRRDGSYLEGQGSFASGTVAASIATMTLPAGLAIDTTILTQGNTSAAPGPQVGYWTGNTTNNVGAILTATGTSTTLLYFGTNGISGQITPQNGSIAFGSAQSVDINFRLPIAGWGVTQILSSDTDTRVIALVASGNAGSVTLATPVIFPTVANDTHGAYNASTGRYTCPAPGYYNVSASVNATTSASSVFNIYKNASIGPQVFITNSSVTGGGSALIFCNGGDIIDIRPSSNMTAVSVTSYSINRLSGAAQIAASEKVFCQYTGNAGTVLTADVTNIDFTTKVTDSHGAWSGTVFTAPRPGFYNFAGSMLITAATARDIFAWVGGVKSYNLNLPNANATASFAGGVFLNAGVTLSFRSDTTVTLSNNATIHWIAITSQG